MIERPKRALSGELKTIVSKNPDYLLVARDVEITDVVIAYERIFFLLDASNRVVGAAVMHAGRGMSAEDLRKPRYDDKTKIK